MWFLFIELFSNQYFVANIFYYLDMFGIQIFLYRLALYYESNFDIIGRVNDQSVLEIIGLTP
jgi:hypothetical protein